MVVESRQSLLLLWWLPLVMCKIPDAEISLNNKIYPATYGAFGSQRAIEGRLVLSLPMDPWMCEAPSSAMPRTHTPEDIFLVKRGKCSFERKYLTAQSFGAGGVVIYNNLESRYGYNETSRRVEFPKPMKDYECEHGQSVIPDDAFSLDSAPYNSSVHDKFLTAGSGSNLCNVSADTCDSGRCLIAGKKGNRYIACCAWDIHVGMDSDDSVDHSSDQGVAVFITMRQAEIFANLEEGTEITISKRPYPKYNPSAFILWVLAVIVTTLASLLSASDYRRAHTKLSNPIAEAEAEAEGIELARPPPPTNITVPRGGHDDEAQTVNANTAGTHSTEVSLDSGHADSVSSPNPTIVRLPPPRQLSDGQVELPIEEEVDARGSSANNTDELSANSPPEDSDEDSDSSNHTRSLREAMSSGQGTTREAEERTVGDVVQITGSQQEEPNPSSEHQGPPAQPQSEMQRRNRRHRQRTSNVLSMELNVWHAVVFVVFASCLLLLLFFFEFYTLATVLYAVGCSGGLYQLIFRPLWNTVFRMFAYISSVICKTSESDLGCIPNLAFLEIVSLMSGYAVGGCWLYVWFTSNDASANVFYWLTQNVMGACISILFLGVLRLNSIKVATVLLVAVFLYDIFFVFLTPYIFDGESVMVTVATSGGPGEMSVDDCEKYPLASGCRRGQPLPMLLTIPRIGDFRGGSNLLGLGDIVLPGLLLSFAARLDAAKRLVRRHTRLEVKMIPKYGYLPWLAASYGVSLLFALLAVVWMERGQPALLYIVPACLGTLLIAGRSEIRDLWKGPIVIKWADRIVHFCDSHTFIARRVEAATEAESVPDDIDNDAECQDDAVDGRRAEF